MGHKPNGSVGHMGQSPVGQMGHESNGLANLDGSDGSVH